MQYYQVEFTINPDGTITEKVLNGSGSNCTELTKDLELGEVNLNNFYLNIKNKIKLIKNKRIIYGKDSNRFDSNSFSNYDVAF